MDDQNTTPRTFSYPNADRSLPENPQPTAPQQAQPKPTVHLQDALAEKSGFTTSSVHNIKTFQSEVASAVKKDNVSMIKIALAEKKRQDKQGTYEDIGASTSKNKAVLIGAFAVVVLVVIGGAFAYFYTRTPAPTTVVNAPLAAQSQIFQSESSVQFDVTDKNYVDIEQFVQNQKNVKIEIGTIQQIKFVQTEGATTTELTSSEFLNVLRARTPESLLRALHNEFIFGIYSLSPRDSFAIFKIDPDSYDSAYAAMLEWERNLESDVGGIFINPVVTIPPDDTGAASATSTLPTVVTQKSFVDRVIQNKDSRVLLGNDGKIKMFYTFFDESTIVFASSEVVLKELAVRLTTGRIAR